MPQCTVLQQKCAHIVHISVTKWCIVGYGTGALWIIGLILDLRPANERRRYIWLASYPTHYEITANINDRKPPNRKTVSLFVRNMSSILLNIQIFFHRSVVYINVLRTSSLLDLFRLTITDLLFYSPDLNLAPLAAFLRFCRAQKKQQEVSDLNHYYVYCAHCATYDNCYGKQYSDATMRQWRLKSPASRMFPYPFVQAHINKNIKALRQWSLWGVSTGDWWIPISPWAKTQIFTYRYHLGGQNLVMFFMYPYAQCII